jgi:multimeric flavodoxin WrbA
MGGLSPPLQRVFDELSTDLSLRKVEGVGSPGWAFIREGSLHSQVVTALNERNFHIDFWYQGFYPVQE